MFRTVMRFAVRLAPFALFSALWLSVFSFFAGTAPSVWAEERKREFPDIFFDVDKEGFGFGIFLGPDEDDDRRGVKVPRGFEGGFERAFRPVSSLGAVDAFERACRCRAVFLERRKRRYDLRGFDRRDGLWFEGRVNRRHGDVFIREIEDRGRFHRPLRLYEAMEAALGEGLMEDVRLASQEGDGAYRLVGDHARGWGVEVKTESFRPKRRKKRRFNR